MEELKILTILIKEFGLKAVTLMLVGWVAGKEFYLFRKKKNGNYVSYSTVKEVAKKLDDSVSRIDGRLNALEKDQQGQIILIEKRHSEIETLRIVSEKMYEVFKQMVDEMKQDARETRADIRDIKEILMKR